MVLSYLNLNNNNNKQQLNNHNEQQIYHLYRFLQKLHKIKQRTTLSIVILIMKEATLKFFRQFDLFSAPASLRINTKPAMKSCMLGIFSLIIFGALIYILVANCLSIIQYQQISYQISETVNANANANIVNGAQTQIQGQISMFAITLGYMRLSRFKKYFDFHLYYYVGGKLQEKIRLKNCQPQQWKQLGQNYNQTFNFYTMDLLFCPPVAKPYKISQSGLKQNSSSISIILTACNSTQRADCNLTGISQLLSLVRYRLVWLLLLDPVLHPQNQQSEIIGYRLTIVKAVVSLYNRQYTQVLLSMFRIQTDTSLYPWQNYQIVTGTMFNSVINNQYQNFQSKTLQTDIFSEISIQMNNKIKNIKRNIGKFDQVISYVGGLFAVIIPGLGWFLSNYSKYRYQIKVAQGAFNFDQQGNKIKEKDFHFGRYVQYTIYNWLNVIFCRKFKWKKCNQIDSARESIIDQMDSRSLFRRLQKIQQMILSKIDNNQDPCISLKQPLSLQNIKKQRLKLDYYDEVIKGEAAATLEDLLLQKHRKSTSENRSSLPKQISSNFEICSAQGLNKMSSLDSQKQLDFNFIALTHGYQLVKQTVDFVKTKEMAQNMVLNPQFNEVQENLSKVYLQFNQPDKHLIENRVPMVILHRLNKRIKQNQEKRKIMGLSEIEEVQQQIQKQNSKLEQKKQQKQEYILNQNIGIKESNQGQNRNQKQRQNRNQKQASEKEVDKEEQKKK